MDHQARLQQMLKSTTSSPQSNSASALLSPSNGQFASPREPSPSPPPPSLQSVSLNDLFKNIQMPTSSANSSAGSTHGGAHRTVSQSSFASLPPSAAPTSVINAAASGLVGPSDQKSKLLGMLSFGNIPSGSTTPQGVTAMRSPPVITHSALPNPIPTSHAGIRPDEHIQDPATKSRSSTPGTTGSAYQTPANTEAHIPTSLSGQGEQNKYPSAPAPAQKPKFDYISPFHAFDSVPKRVASNSGASSGAATRDSSPVKKAQVNASGTTVETPVSVQKDVKPKFGFISPFDAFDDVKTSPAPVPTPTPAQMPTPVQSKPQAPAQMTGLRKVSSRASSQGPQSLNGSSEQKADKSSCNVHDLTEGQNGSSGPLKTSTHIKIDLALPNLSSILPNSTMMIHPTTKMANEVSSKRGRRVGLTADYMAYTMSKGRIRMIDSSSSSRLMLQATTPTPGPIVDLALTHKRVAALANDGSVWIWSVPTSWDHDNPPVDLVSVCHTAGGPLGELFKIEWANKDGREFLVLGGTEGAVVLEPGKEGRGVRTMEELFQGKTVLRTEGPLVDICLNTTNTALGLLSSSSIFTLYNLSSRSRVWKRPLPTVFPGTKPATCQFIESNILIGREKGSFDLVQITTDIAVISSISFSCPEMLKEENNVLALYDSESSLLFLSPFLRSSTFVFHHALSGVPPFRDVSKPDGPKVVGFDSMGELKGHKVLSMAMAYLRTGRNLGLFWASPEGCALGTMNPGALELAGGLSVHSEPIAYQTNADRGTGPESQAETEKSVSGWEVESTVTSRIPSSVPEQASTTAERQDLYQTPAQDSKPTYVPGPSAINDDDDDFSSLAPGPAVVPAPTYSSAAQTPANYPGKGRKKDRQALARAAQQHYAESKAVAAAAEVAENDAGWGYKAIQDVPARAEIGGWEDIPVEAEMVDAPAWPSPEVHPAPVVKPLTHVAPAVVPADAPVPAPVAGISEEQLVYLLQKTEQTIHRELKSYLKGELAPIQFTLSTISSPSFVSEISKSVTSSLKTTLSTQVREEMRKYLDGVSDDLSTEVKAELRDGLGSVAKDMEKVLGGVVVRTLSSTVQSSVEDLIQSTITRTLIPKLKHTTESLTEHLLSEMRSEMLQVRKELEPVASANADKKAEEESALEKMGNEIEAMRAQMGELMVLIKEQGAAPAIPASAPVSAPGLPTNDQLEDTFLVALGHQSVPATLQLVGDHLGLTDYLLPVPAAGKPAVKSPLSQAVLLTLLHRITIALPELSPPHPLYPHLVTWLRRTAVLLDPRDPAIAGYIGKVLVVVRQTLTGLEGVLQSVPVLAAQVRGILDVVGSKIQAVQ